MIEMALDYDLATGAPSNEKPLTGKQKRMKKQAEKAQQPVKREMNQKIQEARQSGKRLEIDCAKVIKPEDYEMPPFLPGHIEVDGNAVAEQIAKIQEPEAEPEIEEIDDAVFVNDDF